MINQHDLVTAVVSMQALHYAKAPKLFYESTQKSSLFTEKGKKSIEKLQPTRGDFIAFRHLFNVLSITFRLLSIDRPQKPY